MTTPDPAAPMNIDPDLLAALTARIDLADRLLDDEHTDCQQLCEELRGDLREILARAQSGR